MTMINVELFIEDNPDLFDRGSDDNDEDLDSQAVGEYDAKDK